MARRHEYRPGDWESVAMRLDEILSAHSGEDPFEEALKILVACLAREVTGGDGGFLAGPQDADVVREVNRWIRIALERWPGILEPSDTTRLSGPELRRCGAVLSSVRLLAEDLVGLDAIFEFVVNKAAKGQKGQYFTPRHVIAEVVAAMRPKAEERIADPACGSGGFLRHALRHEPRADVWGFDQDPRAVRVARVMLAASGQAASRILRCDSLRRPTGSRSSGRATAESAPRIEDLVRDQDPTYDGFDVILTNPPFAGDVGAEFAGSYDLALGKRVERDVLFLERCVELLRPQGRLAIVLPHNKVGGAQWASVRRWLLERLRVVAVLGLGRNTFQPHTSQKACVLIGIKRSEPGVPFRHEEILFFVSDHDGKDPRGRLLYADDGQTVMHDLSEATPLVQHRFDLLRSLEG